MNRSVLQVAQHFVKSATGSEEAMLNRVEAVIRCYDPCLSCSTHAIGEMPLAIELVGPGRRGPGRGARDDRPVPGHRVRQRAAWRRRVGRRSRRRCRATFARSG